MLLIFDGPDKVGKTTLIQEVAKATGYKYPSLDRGPTSFIVYDNLLNRSTFDRNIEFLRDLKDLEKINYLCIYLEADENTVKERLKEADEEAIISHKLFSNEFNEEIFTKEHCCKNLLIINTSVLSISESVKLILDRINMIENTQYPLFKLKEKFCTDKYKEFYPSYNSYSLEILTSIKEKFEIEIDQPYYKMLNSALNHILYKRQIEWINDRQIIYTSNDCISFIQLIPMTENKYDLMICQRSLDLKKHGYNDLLFFVNWIEENNLMIDTIHYNIMVPHIYY